MRFLSYKRICVIILSALTIIAVTLSAIFNREKTILGLKKGLVMFLKLLPSLLTVLILVSIFLYLVPKETITKYLGQNSGTLGMAVAALLGSIALIPGFIAYPLGALLLQGGVSYKIIAVFITTLVMVGVLTLPIEIKFFGVRASLMRNGLSLIGAILIGLIIGVFL